MYGFVVVDEISLLEELQYGYIFKKYIAVGNRQAIALRGNRNQTCWASKLSSIDSGSSSSSGSGTNQIQAQAPTQAQTQAQAQAQASVVVDRAHCSKMYVSR